MPSRFILRTTLWLSIALTLLSQGSLAQTEDVLVSNVTVGIGQSQEKEAYTSISSEGSVIVQGNGQTGGQLTLRARKSIVLKHGFCAQAGSTFSAKVDKGMVPTTDKDMNWVEAISYGPDGSSVAWTKSYADELGRPLQSQSMNMAEFKAVVQQSLYDELGRPVISTLAVPVEQDRLKYIDTFVVCTDGTTPYGVDNFEGSKKYSPDAVGTKQNTLGWYFSSANSAQPYVDKTVYPYSRVEYSQLQPGTARKSTMAGNSHYLGSGHETQTYSMPAADSELQRFVSFDPSVEYKELVKTISVDADGHKSVVYANRDGATIAACMVGTDTGLASPPTTTVTLSTNGSIRYIDVHIPTVNTTVTVTQGSVAHVYDLSNDNLLSQYSGNSITFTQAGFYRLIGNSSFSINYTTTAYNSFSLNVYDKAGRLIRTYSPLAIERNQATCCTKYTYNSLGWLMQVDSPDEGLTKYLYRKDGAIRFSQNAQQKIDHKFSYTDYDAENRPIESGEYLEGSLFFSDLTGETVLPGSRDDSSNAYRTQRHKTWYGEDGNQKAQNFVNGTVSKTEFDGVTSYYSYTYDGKVEWAVRYYPDLGEKKIAYLYDFFGNVTEVQYQPGVSGEEFVHYYTYDDNLRLSAVYTKRGVDVAKTLQAKYFYYPHGALKRVELAGNLQGVDYVYNVNGMLKSINHPNLNTQDDPGQDGVSNGFQRDAFAMALDYYSGDYTGNANVKTSTGLATNNYNGNIAAMRWGHIGTRTDNTNASQNIYTYAYNNRSYLSGANFGTYSHTSNNYTAYEKYKEYGYSYDANGNILALNRKDANGAMMDQLTYNYESTNYNRLNYVIDAVGTSNLGDINTQSANNYGYNAIGQLVSNVKDQQTFTYNATGLVAQMATKNGNVTYKYDDAGFRTTTITPNGTTYYVRDVSGNIMAVYNAAKAAIEYPVYGTSRLGTAYTNGTAVAYNYELTDHLGNVRAVVASSNGSLAVQSNADYYPFGLKMPGLVKNSYRFGYQGQFAEEDKETGFNQFEARLYDSRLGRWLTTAPAGQYWSPYMAMGNSPQISIDSNGEYSYLGALWRMMFWGGNSLAKSKTTGEWGFALSGAGNPGYMGENGMIGPETISMRVENGDRPFIGNSTLSAKELNILDKIQIYRETPNSFGHDVFLKASIECSYGVIDDITLYSTKVFTKYPRHLNGEIANDNTVREASVMMFAGFATLGTEKLITSEMKILKRIDYRATLELGGNLTRHVTKTNRKLMRNMHGYKLNQNLSIWDDIGVATYGIDVLDANK